MQAVALYFNNFIWLHWMNEDEKKYWRNEDGSKQNCFFSHLFSILDLPFQKLVCYGTSIHHHKVIGKEQYILVYRGGQTMNYIGEKVS
jgi:hypothetical protein